MENTESVGTVVAHTLSDHLKNVLHIDALRAYIAWPNLIKFGISAVTIILFYIIYRLVKRVIKKRAVAKFQPNTVVFLNKIVSYSFYILIFMYVLSLFGISLKAVWGAAGVAGLAIGFAAQTSVSNLISGIFVLGEKAMKIGDYISVGDTSGTVDTVGLLSVTVHTLDNQMVRIPNSTIINTNMQNYSYFPVRRLVFEIPIKYEENLSKALASIKRVPALCPTVLSEPEPVAYYDGFSASVVLKLAVWINNKDLLQTKNDVYMNIVKVCDEDEIELAYTRYNVAIVSGGKTNGINQE